MSKHQGQECGMHALCQAHGHASAVAPERIDYAQRVHGAHVQLAKVAF
jgi:hypothetical protein